MKICDVCKGPENVQGVGLKIINPVKENDYDVTIDLCSKCIKYADPNTFIIGLKEIRDNAVPQKAPVRTS